jgi:hypothetical protein
VSSQKLSASPRILRAATTSATWSFSASCNVAIISWHTPSTIPYEELRHLLEAAFTPEETWVAATRWAGESLGKPKLGRLEEGAPADFLIFREDPSHDLAALSTLEAVVAQGRLYRKEVLDGAIQRHRDTSRVGSTIVSRWPSPG